MESKYIDNNAIDIANMDTTINPAIDFYAYANGGWIKNNPLPQEFSRYGTFDQLADNNKEQLKELIETIAKGQHKEGTIEQKIADFYNSGMDSSKIDKEGIGPVLPEIEKINRINNLDDLQKHIVNMHNNGIFPLFVLYSAPDKMNSNFVIANLYQGGLNLPDVEYYTANDKRTKNIRNEYHKYIVGMFVLSGMDSLAANNVADVIMHFETRLARCSMTRLERRDPYKTYNKMSLMDLSSLSGYYNWNLYFKNIGLNDPGDINVSQPEFFTQISKILEEIPIEEWKYYLKWNVLNKFAPYLSSDFVDLHFSFYGSFLSGKEEIEPRWKRVLRQTNYAMGEAIGQMYVEKYFPPEAKTRMLELVNNLKIALQERINNVDWMSNETKQKAIEKLSAMKVKVGYPDKWRDYSELMVLEDSYIDNIIHSNKFNFDFELNKVNKPVDPGEWHMTPQTVNAYYNPSQNEIVFPAAILQPPFFYLNADDAVNYGAIGVVIGHEMTHGFDDQGRKYDLNGNLTEWWTKEDEERFMKKTDVLVNQFNNFIILDSTHANGRLTLGENIADLGGINVAYTALKIAAKNKNIPEIVGFTQDQRFFISYAFIWAQNIRDEEILRRTKEDVHSLGRFRVIGPLKNVPEFHKAFGIKPGDPMYLAEKERALIW